MDRVMKTKFNKARRESAKLGQRMFENEREALYHAGVVTPSAHLQQDSSALTGQCWVWFCDGVRRPYKNRFDAYNALTRKGGYRMRDKDGSDWVYECVLYLECMPEYRVFTGDAPVRLETVMNELYACRYMDIKHEYNEPHFEYAVRF